VNGRTVPRTKNALPPPSPRVQFHIIDRMRSGQASHANTFHELTTRRCDWKCGSGKCDTVKNARMENAVSTLLPTPAFPFLHFPQTPTFSAPDAL